MAVTFDDDPPWIAKAISDGFELTRIPAPTKIERGQPTKLVHRCRSLLGPCYRPLMGGRPYVENLSCSTAEMDLRRLFAPLGTVADAKLVMPSMTTLELNGFMRRSAKGDLT